MSNKDDRRFRVWDEETHEYNTNVYITYVLEETGSLMVADNTFYERGVDYRCPRHKYKVERCTGLRNQAGALVYQNDRIHIEDPIPGVQEDADLVVTWDKGGWIGQGKHGKYSLWAALTYHKVRVVGTIHDKEV